MKYFILLNLLPAAWLLVVRAPALRRLSVNGGDNHLIWGGSILLLTWFYLSGSHVREGGPIEVGFPLGLVIVSLAIHQYRRAVLALPGPAQLMDDSR